MPNGSNRKLNQTMKKLLHLAIIFVLTTMSASRTTVSSKVSTHGIKRISPNRAVENIIYNETYKALLSPNPQLIKDIRSKLRELHMWFLKKEEQDTFIGRCFGVARQIKFAMPIIMVKLGVIVTILIFLTIFSIKTIGLLLVMLMFGASSVFTKFALWKSESSNHQQKPQNVHFHIHPGKRGEYNIAPSGSPWDRTSAEYANNFAEPDSEFQEKLNYLAKYQKGLFDMGSK